MSNVNYQFCLVLSNVKKIYAFPGMSFVIILIITVTNNYFLYYCIDWGAIAIIIISFPLELQNFEIK